MPPLDAVIVGYREHDRRRLRLVDDYGAGMVRVRKCAAGCGYPVWFHTSDSVMQKLNDGAEVVCEQCGAEFRSDIRDAL